MEPFVEEVGPVDESLNESVRRRAGASREAFNSLVTVLIPFLTFLEDKPEFAYGVDDPMTAFFLARQEFPELSDFHSALSVLVTSIVQEFGEAALSALVPIAVDTARTAVVTARAAQQDPSELWQNFVNERKHD